MPSIQQDIIHCTRCPELNRYCHEIAVKKKRQFKDQTYWGKPVPSFGKLSASFWILGLAPAAHGANRTGRMFTGDSSGDWLYRKLFKYGFCTQSESIAKNDGLRLMDTYISAVIHCAPPQNRPTPKQIDRCEIFVDREFAALKKLRLILCTGGISFQALKRLLKRNEISTQNWQFSHGAFYETPNFSVLCTYHPSRQNTNTGRLTDPMWDKIFKKARAVLDS